MGFMDMYKRLEKLCGEVLNDDRRVSAYIDEMVNIPHGGDWVDGWYHDLKQLKHYRWVRNRIAHDPGCTEENMCQPGDTKWINGFCDRIMNGTDPLTLYRKATRKYTTPKAVYRPVPVMRRTSKRGTNAFLRGVIWVLLFMIAAVLLYLVRQG